MVHLFFFLLLFDNCHLKWRGFQEAPAEISALIISILFSTMIIQCVPKVSINTGEYVTSTVSVEPPSVDVVGCPLLGRSTTLPVFLNWLNKFGESVVCACDALATFPVNVHLNLATASQPQE